MKNMKRDICILNQRKNRKAKAKEFTTNDTAFDDFADFDASDNDWLDELHMTSSGSQHLRARRAIEQIQEERAMRKYFDDFSDFDEL